MSRSPSINRPLHVLEAVLAGHLFLHVYAATVGLPKGDPFGHSLSVRSQCTVTRFLTCIHSAVRINVINSLSSS